MNKTTRPVMRTPRKPKPTTSAVKKAHTAKPNARAVTLTIIANRPIWQLLSGAYHASSSCECEKTKPHNSQNAIYGTGYRVVSGYSQDVTDGGDICPVDRQSNPRSRSRRRDQN